MEVIIVGAESTQAQKLAVRDSAFVVIRMERREMKIVVSICFSCSSSCSSSVSVIVDAWWM